MPAETQTNTEAKRKAGEEFRKKALFQNYPIGGSKEEVTNIDATIYSYMFSRQAQMQHMSFYFSKISENTPIPNLIVELSQEHGSQRYEYKIEPGFNQLPGVISIPEKTILNVFLSTIEAEFVLEDCHFVARI